MILRCLITLSLSIVLQTDRAFPQQYFVDETESRLPDIVDRSFDAEFGDLNGDGSLDLIVANSNNGLTQFCYYILNNSSGIYLEDSLSYFEYDLALTSINGIAVGDIERDGDFDILLTNITRAFDTIHHLYVNDGSANFVDRSESLLPIHDSVSGRDAHFIDINSDLDLDLAIYEWDGNPNNLWINMGNGRFIDSPGGSFLSGYDDTYNAAWFDVDLDFDLDCLLVNGNGDSNKIMINDGNGWFTEEGATRLPVDMTMSVDVDYFDLDNDGDLDAYIAAGFTPGYDRILLNNGSGYFADESFERIPQYGDHSLGVDIGDIDNDGDFDIFVANSSYYGTRSPRLYVNDGTGHFTDETSERYPSIDEESSFGTFGDVDGDGDLDLFVVNHGFEDGEQNRLLLNVSSPDSFPPVINRTLIHEDTSDTLGPYILMTEVWDNISRNIGELNIQLYYRYDDNEYESEQMYDCGGSIFRQGIGGFSSGSVVNYYIRAVDRMGNISLDPPNAPDSVYSFMVTGTGIEDEIPTARVPRTFSLSQNYPNPFNPTTVIQYNIPEGQETGVSLTVYDLHGRIVNKLVDEKQAPGIHRVNWTGKDTNGIEVASGVYIYRLRASNFTSTRKMVLVR